MDGRDRESVADVLRCARKHGFEPVSDVQRMRYHREGVLPRPTTRGLGRGRGSESDYPSGTGKQLVRLLHLLGEKRSFDTARYVMWWEGYTVDEEKVRCHLATALEEIAPLVDAYSHYEGRTEGSHDDLVESFFVAAAGHRLKSPLLGRGRRRTGRADFRILAAMVLELFAGTASEWGEDEAALLTRATGLPAVLTPFIEGPLRAIDGDLALSSVMETLQNAAPSDLRAARTNLQVIEGALQQLSGHASEPTWSAFSARAHEFSLADVFRLPLVLAAMLHMRQRHSVREAISMLRRGLEASQHTEVRSLIG